jgi:hypothetical protein
VDHRREEEIVIVVAGVHGVDDGVLVQVGGRGVPVDSMSMSLSTVAMAGG